MKDDSQAHLGSVSQFTMLYSCCPTFAGIVLSLSRPSDATCNEFEGWQGVTNPAPHRAAEDRCRARPRKPAAYSASPALPPRLKVDPDVPRQVLHLGAA